MVEMRRADWFAANTRDFLAYVAQLIAHPRNTLGIMLGDPRRMSYGIAAILALVVIYTFGISITLVLHPATKPIAFPVLRIAPEQYYEYELFFLLPVASASVILHAGVAHLVCRPWDGRGTFDDLFALIGFSYIVVTLVIGIPDLLLGLLRPATTVGAHVVLGSIWFAALSVCAIKEAEKVRWVTAVVAGTAGLLANAAVQITFTR